MVRVGFEGIGIGIELGGYAGKGWGANTETGVQAAVRGRSQDERFGFAISMYGGPE
jgi:hypothetical protein